MKGIKIYIDDYMNARKAIIAAGEKMVVLRLDNIELSIDRPHSFGRRVDTMMREVKSDDPKYNVIIERYKELIKQVSIAELI